MTRATLWTRHRNIAFKIANRTSIRGADRADLEQEALLALWEATAAWKSDRGPFSPFAALVIERRLIDLIRRAQRQPRVTVLQDVHAAPESQLSLPRLIEALGLLSDLERESLAAHLGGVAATSSKRHNNALTNARRKLRAAA